MQAIVSYLNQTQTYSLSRYIIEMTLLGYVGKTMSALLFFSLMYSITGQNIMEEMDEPVLGIALVISAVFVAPLVETVVGQMLPVFFTGLVTKNIYIQVLVSTLFFTALHPFPAYGALLPVAFIFAWTYVIKQKKSVWHAYGVTALMHGLHNAIALIFIM